MARPSMPLKCFTNTHQEVPETPLCVCFHGFMLQMKGRALVNIDERCNSTLFTKAELEMRDVAFAHTHTHTPTQKFVTQFTQKSTLNVLPIKGRREGIVKKWK